MDYNRRPPKSRTQNTRELEDVKNPSVRCSDNIPDYIRTMQVWGLKRQARTSTRCLPNAGSFQKALALPSVLIALYRNWAPSE